MPLFECTKCHCIENTATGDYWPRKIHDEPPLCSKCSTGEWHNKFPKKSAAGMQVDEHGFLWSKGQVEAGVVPPHFKIVGEVQPHSRRQRQ